MKPQERPKTTANHAHTPTKGDLKKAWDWYRANQDKQSGIEQNFRTYRFEFLRAWDAIESAAEQRGAVKALREAAFSPRLGDAIRWAIKHPTWASRARRSFENYLLQESNRAEQHKEDNHDE